jgi:general secretion pathway protein J
MKKLNHGFTLIEMVVALGIGAAIALLSYQALSGAINIESRVNQLTQQINSVQRVWQFFSDDLQHAVARPWVDDFGNAQPVMVGLLGDRLSQNSGISIGDDSYLLRFVRSGDNNFLNQPRSDLQAIGYRITNDDPPEEATVDAGPTVSLWRDHWRPVDDVNDPRIKSRRLIDNIKTIRLRYLSAESMSVNDEAWITGWPESSAKKNQLPIAVEIVMDIVGFGEVVRLFPLVQTMPK